MKTYLLEEVCEKITDGSHFSPQGIEKGFPMLSVKDMEEYGFKYVNCKYISKIDFIKLKKQDCVPQKDDILVAKDGSYLKHIFICDEEKEEAILSSIALFRPNKKIIVPKYLMYLLKSPNVFNNVKNNYVSGSALPRIVLKDFKRISFKIPNYDIQLKIVHILENIDNIIKINMQINNNLEQQAQLLFKSWFVDFEPFNEELVEWPNGLMIPKSLQMLQINDIPHVLETGRRPKGGAVSDGIPSIGAENVKKLGEVNLGSVKYIPEDFAIKMKTGHIQGYELLLYKDGGKPGIFIPHFSMFGEGFPYENFFINEHVFKLDFFDRGYNEFMYFYLQTDYPYNWLANNGGKAAVPGINQQDVNAIWTFNMHNEKVKEFCNWVQPVFTKILSNCAQNIKLATIRDNILPKLMSRELDVSDIEI